MDEIEQDFTYNVIKSAEELIGNGNVYSDKLDVAVYIILYGINRAILSEAASKVNLEDRSFRMLKIIHEFYIRWRNNIVLSRS